MSEVKGRGKGRAPGIFATLVTQRADQKTQSRATQEDAMKNLLNFTRWSGLMKMLDGLVKVKVSRRLCIDTPIE